MTSRADIIRYIRSTGPATARHVAARFEMTYAAASMALTRAYRDGELDRERFNVAGGGGPAFMYFIEEKGQE